MSDKPNPAAELDVERLARMASVDGSWWQECDRPARLLRSYYRYGAVGTLIGSLIGYAMFMYAILS